MSSKQKHLMIIFDKILSMEAIRSHIKTLYLVARIDNKLLAEEIDYLFELGERNNLSVEEIKNIMSDDVLVEFTLPDDTEARVQQLFELIKMMLVDNRLDEREAALCVRVAREMGFNKSLVGGLVSTLVNAADDEADIALTKKELEYYINHPEII